MSEYELICFQIISNVGMAKNKYMEATKYARDKAFDLANKAITEGDKHYLEGHKSHARLIQKESQGDNLTINLLLIHAEDQLMNAETIKILAEELIAVYQHMKMLVVK